MRYSILLAEGGVLDLVLVLGKHQAEQAALLAKVFEYLTVLIFQRTAIAPHQGAPA